MGWVWTEWICNRAQGKNQIIAIFNYLHFGSFPLPRLPSPSSWLLKCQPWATGYLLASGFRRSRNFAINTRGGWFPDHSSYSWSGTLTFFYHPGDDFLAQFSVLSRQKFDDLGRVISGHGNNFHNGITLRRVTGHRQKLLLMDFNELTARQARKSITLFSYTGILFDLREIIHWEWIIWLILGLDLATKHPMFILDTRTGNDKVTLPLPWKTSMDPLLDDQQSQSPVGKPRLLKAIAFNSSNSEGNNNNNIIIYVDDDPPWNATTTGGSPSFRLEADSTPVINSALRSPSSSRNILNQLRNRGSLCIKVLLVVKLNTLWNFSHGRWK